MPLLLGTTRRKTTGTDEIQSTGSGADIAGKNIIGINSHHLEAKTL